jgi:hypothetical protein
MIRLDLIGRQLGQHFAEHFDGALHVSLDDHAQFLDFAGLQLFMQLVESDAPTSAGSESCIALLALTVIDDVASLGFVGDLEVVTGFGDTL